MPKSIKTEVICYWGKSNSHTARVTSKGDLLLYWGKKKAPSFNIRGAEVTVETDAHITVEIDSPFGFIELEEIGKYSWSTDKDGCFTLLDTRGRALRILPSGHVEEETFNEREAQKVAAEVSKLKAQERTEKSGKALKALVGIAALVYLLKLIFK